MDPLADRRSWVSPYNYVQNNPILRIDPTGALDTLPDGRNIWELDNREMQLFSEASTRSQVTGCNCDIQLSIPERLYMFGKMLTFAMPSARILKGATVIDDIARVGDDAGRLTRLSTRAIVEKEVVETVVEGAAKGGSQILNTTTRQLQAKFKHAVDFGITGNWNKTAAGRFNSAINQHINSTGVKTINGTYRGQSVIHHLNPNTGLNVISSPSGQFISGWKLNPAQLQNVLKHGGL